ncbi:MAG: deoxyribose-phosphate aldolase [Firmicutes bacterium]|nr:deoxyribose-phosphate aldolase [Erysipelotrichaceae bacterium]MDD7227855.1 deoxyribose-phosphate aldolase [Bacillota bacterium]MDY4973203.1 deoxyribose-phosphate aldolase [Erysipelotrichaceae bacterium]MDY5998189.1 deoxyribose-phosphate aldolase [Erysipelotrichaceae bacterium]
MKKEYLAKMFDHTYLKAFASKKDMEKLCQEAKMINCKMVAINSCQTKLCKQLLKDSDIHVGAAISFPLGQTTIETKLFETKDAIENGADEIDYVVNLTKVKDHDFDYIEDEMRQITKLCHDNKVICKVIFENCYLEKEEIIKLSEIALKVKPDFIKTSTGFGTSGAKVEDVALMKSIVKDEVMVKAAGGIRDLETCMAMIKAGASRIGTSSSLKILEELDNVNAD